MPFKRSRKGKQANKASSSRTTTPPPPSAALARPPPAAVTTSAQDNPAHEDLILTSAKRRGVYECDYCRSDISQLPRVRCAVCPDFDLCLDCFATADHATTLARLKSAVALTATAGDHPPAVVAHQDTHGYRVCYSTRYPLFPASKRQLTGAATTTTTTTTSTGSAAPSRSTSNVGDDDDDDGDEKSSSVVQKQPTKKDSLTEETTTADPKVADSTAAAKVQKQEPQQPDTSSDANVPTAAAVEQQQPVTTLWHDMSNLDPKTVWTVEEDLRLIEGIQMHGLANWVEIAEVVGGQGSTGKTPKRCMERYFDEFLGRYGHILPAYTLLAEQEDQEGGTAASQGESNNNGDGTDSANNDNAMKVDNNDMGAAAPAAPVPEQQQPETLRTSKRRAVLMRSPSTGSSLNHYGAASLSRSNKRFKAVPTESLPGYDQIWPRPYIPHDQVKVGQEVGRDSSVKAEQAFVRAVSNVSAAAASAAAAFDPQAQAAAVAQKVQQIRREWTATRLNQPGGPTVLPLRPDDVLTLPGATLAGFMPRRGDFDVEWENDAEQAVADMEFVPGESVQDQQLKLQVLAIYNTRLDEREKRKQFILNRKLYDYRQRQAADLQLPRDERDLVLRMRLLERFHTPAEHEQFLADILQAKRLRKEIAKLQLYRRIGIRTLAEAEKYELDKARHEYHKTAHLQKVVQAAAEASSKGGDGGGKKQTKSGSAQDDNSSSSLWKQYKTSHRKVRKSIDRGNPKPTSTSSEPPAAKEDATEKNSPGTTTTTTAAENDPKKKAVVKTEEALETAASKGKDKDGGGDDDAMDVDPAPPNAASLEAAAAAASEGGAANDKKVKDEETTKDQDQKAGSEKDPDHKNKNSVSQHDYLARQQPEYKLLSPKEVALCTKSKLLPAQYLELKRVLVHQSLQAGLLEKDGGSSGGSSSMGSSSSSSNNNNSSRRILVKIDVERRGGVIDFLVRAGWVSTTIGDAAKCFS